MGIRLQWIDTLKGFCMLAILLFHTEIYFTGTPVIPYSLYVVNALTTFFCISGYLMYRPEGIDISHKIKSIVYSLLIPYFIFTTLIAIPKTIAHHQEIDFLQIGWTILSGNASWFIATLITAELLFLWIIHIAKSRVWIIFAVNLLFFLLSIYLSNVDVYNFWHFKNAFMAVFFLCLGYLYHRYEDYFQLLNKYIFIIFILLIVIKIYVFKENITLGLDTFQISSYPVFLLDTISCIWLLFYIFPKLPHMKFTAWIGRHCIVFYFLCGGIPLLTSMIAHRIGFTYQDNYLYVIPVYLLVIMFTAILTWLIYKFFPFITGKSFKTTKQLLFIVLSLFLFALPAHSQLHLNGKEIIFDSLTNTYLATIPQQSFGSDYICQIKEIDNIDYTFKNIQPNKKYSISIKDKTADILFTFLPIIELEGSFGYDYTQGFVSYNHPDNSQIETYSSSIKWRGGSTNTEEKHKRNYKIKFDKDVCFFGLRTDNNWILDAGQADVFRLRNRIATEIWNDFAQKPYYASQEPDALSGVRGQVVEVFLNHKYQGIYAFTENMDRKQMKVKKIDKNTGKIRGVLWKSKGYGALMNEAPDYNNQEEMWNTFEAKYPDFSDNDTTDWKTLHDAIKMVIEAPDNTFSEQAVLLFDIPVFIDYYIFINILGAVDNVGKNMYWAVYDQTKSKMITPAVWDLDGTVGQRWLEIYADIFSSPQYDMTYTIKLIDRLVDLNTENFNEKVRERYKELRNSVFMEEKLKQRYINYLHILEESGAAEREKERWSGDTDIRGEIINFKEETDYICQWITKRLQFLDNQWNYTTTVTPVNSENNISDHAVYTVLGQKVSKKNLSKGIYIKNRKKIIVR